MARTRCATCNCTSAIIHTFTPERIEFHETGTFTVERKLLRILFVDVSGPDHRTAGIEGKRIVFLGPEDAERQLFEKAEP